MSMGVLDTQPQHGSRSFSGVEDVFDLALQLEEVVLSEVNFLQLKPDGLFYDCLQVLHNFVVLFLMLHPLINHAIVGHSFHPEIILALSL